MISAVFGFGTALIVLAIGAHILPVKETIVLATVMFCAASLIKSWVYFQDIDWRTTAIVTVGCLPFTYLGGTLLFETPPELIRQILGVMILIYVALTSLITLPSFSVKTPTLVIGSAIYGFVSGFIGSGNLIKVILFRELNFAKESFVGIMAATAILVNFVKLATYYKSGLLTPKLYFPSIFLVLGTLLTVLLGKYCLQKFSAKHFGISINVILVASAFALLF